MENNRFEKNILLCLLAIIVVILAIVVDDLRRENDNLKEQCRTAWAGVAPSRAEGTSAEQWNDFIKALAWVESRWDESAVGDKDDVGLLQITPVVVAEANRIMGCDYFTLEDRYDPQRSIEMFCVIQESKNPDHDIHLALKIWNPLANLSYHDSVMRSYHKILSGEILGEGGIRQASIGDIIEDTLQYNWQMLVSQ